MSAQEDAQAVFRGLGRAGGESEIQAWSAKPEGHGQEIGGQSKHGEGGGGEEFPVGRTAEGDGAELDDLEDGEGQGEKGRPEQGEGKTEQRSGCEDGIGEGDQAVVKRDGALPRQVAQECAALVFFVIGKGGEVENEKVCESERGERNGEERQQAVDFAGLE